MNWDNHFHLKRPAENSDILYMFQIPCGFIWKLFIVEFITIFEVVVQRGAECWGAHLIWAFKQNSSAV